MIFYKGDHLAYRYSISSLLGMGTFGTVCRAFDHKTKEFVAIKVIRNAKEFTEQGKLEIKILKILKDTTGVIKMKRHFLFRGHICLVFELLDSTLYDTLKAQWFKGFELTSIRNVAGQVLKALHYIRRSGIIHSDLKPENIMLYHDRKVQIIDFGSACFVNDKLHRYVQSRFYRAPEVILGLKYSTHVDMWSFGCIIYELRTGKPLFNGNNEFEQILLFVETLGLPPSDLLKRARDKRKFFDEDDRLKTGKLSSGRTIVPGERSIRTLLKGEDDDFIDLICRCLTWVPEERIKPRNCIAHQFFKI